MKNCVEMSRVLHGALETLSCENNGAFSEHQVPSEIDLSRLETFRYFQSADPSDSGTNRLGKGMLDVSKLEGEELTSQSPHRPSALACPKARTPYIENSLILHHYVGSWERYSARNDSRRTRLSWKQKGNVSAANSCDRNIRSWLPKFVAQVGPARAAFLLGHREL